MSGAKLLANEAAIANGKSATQVFGGMGFTWEVDVHLYLKRAWVLDTHFGSIDHHADALAATLTQLSWALKKGLPGQYAHSSKCSTRPSAAKRTTQRSLYSCRNGSP